MIATMDTSNDVHSHHPPTPPSDLAALQRKADEHLAGWQRAKADYLNLKREAEREKAAMAQIAVASVVVDLLPVYDGMKRALQHIPEAVRGEEWAKGVSHVLDSFRQLFHRYGIEEIRTLGERFDHERHHAVAKERREGVAPETVIEELKTGFTMNGKVIEPAQVRVAE